MYTSMYVGLRQGPVGTSRGPARPHTHTGGGEALFALACVARPPGVHVVKTLWNVPSSSSSSSVTPAQTGTPTRHTDDRRRPIVVTCLQITRVARAEVFRTVANYRVSRTARFVS